MEENHESASSGMAQTEEFGERCEINVNNCSNINTETFPLIDTDNFEEIAQNCETLEENYNQSDNQVPAFTNQTECNSSNNNDSGIIYNNQDVDTDGCHVGGSGETLVEELQQDSIREALGLPGWSKMQKNNNNNRCSFRKKRNLKRRGKLLKRKPVERCRSKTRKCTLRKRSVSKKSKAAVKKTRSSRKPNLKIFEQREEDKIEDHLKEPSLPINDRKKLANPNINNDNNSNNSNNRFLKKSETSKNRSRVNYKSSNNIRKRSVKKRRYSPKKENVCRVCRSKMNATNSNNNNNKKSITAKKLSKDNKRRRSVSSRKGFNKKRTLKKVKKNVSRNRNNNNNQGLNQVNKHSGKSREKQTVKKRRLNDSLIRKENPELHPSNDESQEDLLNDGMMFPKCRSLNMNSNNNNIKKNNLKKKNRTPIPNKKSIVKSRSRSRSRAQGMSSSIMSFENRKNRRPVKKNRCIVKKRKNMKRMKNKKGSNIPNLILDSSSKTRRPTLSYRSPKDRSKLMSSVKRARKRSDTQAAKKRMATIKKNRQAMKRKASAMRKISGKRRASANKSSNNKKVMKADTKGTSFSSNQYSDLANNEVKNNLKLKNKSWGNSKPSSRNRSLSKKSPVSRKRSPIKKNSGRQRKSTKCRGAIRKKRPYTKSRSKKTTRKYTRKAKHGDKGTTKSGHDDSGGGITGGLAGMFGFKKMFNSKESNVKDLFNNSNNNNGRKKSIKKSKRSNKKEKMLKKKKVNFKNHNSYHSVSLSDLSDC